MECTSKMNLTIISPSFHIIVKFRTVYGKVPCFFISIFTLVLLVYSHCSLMVDYWTNGHGKCVTGGGRRCGGKQLQFSGNVGG